MSSSSTNNTRNGRILTGTASGWLVGAFSCGGRQRQAKRRAFAERGFDFDGAQVALQNAVDHGQSQAGAQFALGGEERFEASLAHVLGHSRAGIGDLHDDPRIGGTCAHGDGAALRHRIDRVENQVGERLPQVRFAAGDRTNSLNSVTTCIVTPLASAWFFHFGCVSDTACSINLLRSTGAKTSPSSRWR